MLRMIYAKICLYISLAFAHRSIIIISKPYNPNINILRNRSMMKIMENMLLTRLDEELERYCMMSRFMLSFFKELTKKEFELIDDIILKKKTRILYWLIDLMESVVDHDCNDIDHVSSVINDYRSDIINDLNGLLSHDCFSNSALKSKIKDYIRDFEKESLDLDRKFHAQWEFRPKKRTSSSIMTHDDETVIKKRKCSCVGGGS